eukprot:1456500-Alexandrium_andersonii.AAC.1
MSTRSNFNTLAWPKVTEIALQHNAAPLVSAYRAVLKAGGTHPTAHEMSASQLAEALLQPHPRVVFAVSRLRLLGHLASSPPYVLDLMNCMNSWSIAITIEL